MTEDEFDNKIQEWHEGAGGDVEVHEYLGITLEEYQDWFRTGEVPESLRGA